jgi:class 3 adenylate cyclase
MRNEDLSPTLVEELRRIIRPVISKHFGREVKTIGDALLLEFQSAFDYSKILLKKEKIFSDRSFFVETEARKIALNLHRLSAPS